MAMENPSWHSAKRQLFGTIAQRPLLRRTSSGPPDEGIEPLDFAAMSRFFASVVRGCYDEGPPKPLLLWILSAWESCLLRISADRGAIRVWLSRLFWPRFEPSSELSARDIELRHEEKTQSDMKKS